MDREMRELDRTEKQVMAEIKQRAKAPGVSGQGDAALKSLAKQLVQIRKQREKLISAKVQMGAVGEKVRLLPGAEWPAGHAP